MVTEDGDSLSAGRRKLGKVRILPPPRQLNSSAIDRPSEWITRIEEPICTEVSSPQLSLLSSFFPIDSVCSIKMQISHPSLHSVKEEMIPNQTHENNGPPALLGP